MRIRPWTPPEPRAEPRRVLVSERESQMLTGLFMGLTNRAVANSLYVSEETVKTHMTRLFRKLEVANRAEAVALVATGVVAVDVKDFGRSANV